MNCPSRTDDTDGRKGWNQSPNLLAGTTRADFNGCTNATARRSLDPDIPGDDIPIAQTHVERAGCWRKGDVMGHVTTASGGGGGGGGEGGLGVSKRQKFYEKSVRVFIKYSSFIGPGFIVREGERDSVAVFLVSGIWSSVRHGGPPVRNRWFQDFPDRTAVQSGKVGETAQTAVVPQRLLSNLTRDM
ncbi:hypothetical protein V498_08786 [Pseudogymnoascus sp. VKM F-4517 (FW-2822)]|nr:hypothetical protein V498_08786 [Pseudogymnoascus sp. VKM F-4517 (FW-2822)]